MGIDVRIKRLSNAYSRRKAFNELCCLVHLTLILIGYNVFHLQKLGEQDAETVWLIVGGVGRVAAGLVRECGGGTTGHGLPLAGT
jgi:hypothetical protein